MAISTYKSLLTLSFTVPKQSGTGTEKKNVNVFTKSYPDLGQAPNTLEITTQADPCQKYIPGIKQSGILSFTANYDHALMKQLRDYMDVSTATTASIHIDYNGNDAYWKCTVNNIDIRVTGGGVDEVVEMTLDIVPSSALDYRLNTPLVSTMSLDDEPEAEEPLTGEPPAIE